MCIVHTPSFLRPSIMGRRRDRWQAQGPLLDLYGGTGQMTNRWRVAGDEEAAQCLDQIAAALERLFGITSTEARQRIENGWAHLPDGGILGGGETPDIIFHEDDEYWAHHFYYGSGAFWWLSGEERERQGLAPLKPVSPDSIHGEPA